MKNGHLQVMGDKWSVLLGAKNSEQLAAVMPGIIGTTLEYGGTRPVWSKKDDEQEHMLMAWPSENLLRTSVVVAGPPEGQLSPVAVAPFMEGFANDLMVKEAFPWKDSHEGEVLAQPNGFLPLWFYDPLFFRDAAELVEGKIIKFYLSGLCYALRKALLDELTVTEGPAYEKHALEWMKANPTKSRLDVPPLKIPLKGKSLIDLGENYCEYQCHAPIFDVGSFMFGPEQAQQKIYRFGIEFGDPQHRVYAILYAPERVCGKYVPAEGDDVDIYFWMQGRIADAEAQETGEQKQE